jgi:hypothetical protein
MIHIFPSLLKFDLLLWSQKSIVSNSSRATNSIKFLLQMAESVSIVEKLFSTNAQWAKAVDATEPGFFLECAKGQAPQVCDSSQP